MYGGSTYGGSTYGGTSDTTKAVVAGTTTITSTTSGGVGAQATTTTTTTTTGTVGALATTAATTTATGSLSNAATSFPAPTEFRVTRDGTTVEDAVFDVDPIVDTANPFGDYAVVKMDDRGGQKFEQYPRGTRIDVDITTNFGVDYTRRFTGYVVERRETEQQGADVLEVEAYTFDQFLRRNTVTNNQTGNLISEALADIIQTDTPVSYVSGNVEVGDDQELTRGYQGVSVEETLRDLAFKSNNEEFGVNDSLEFFFRPQETEHIDRGIDNSQWFNYDIPELGKETINEVEVWFNDGEESVIVDDGTDKLDLQDSLGLPSPGTQRHELNRPLITNIADAEDIGRKYLAFRNSTLSGTVTTFGLYDAEPGDTIDVTIDPRGIDTEFLIAAMEYRWGRDETILTIVEKRGDVDDILTELNDSVQRVEMNGANRDAPSNRITTTNSAAIVDVTIDADGNTPSGVRFVNDGRRSVRDAWIGESPPTIDTIAVGSNGSGLSRSNTSLNNQSNSAAASETLPNSTSVEYSASITQTGVEEVGLLTTSGTLMARAVFSSPVDLDGSVTVTLDVLNDDSVSRGVLTSGGQTAVRDCLADNTPAVPDEYAYGSDGTPVSESDTSLAAEEVRVGLDEIVIQDANSTSEWDAITPDLSGIPLVVESGVLKQVQTAFTVEGEDAGVQSGTDVFRDSRFSGNGPTSGDGEALRYDGSGQAAEWTFTPQHTIPASDFELQIRFESNNTPALDFTLNGVTWEGINDGGTVQNVGWRDFADDATGGVTDGYTGGDLEAGTTYTLRIESTSSGGTSPAAYVDVIAPLDGRYSHTLDNALSDGSDGGRYLSGPELYASQVVQPLNTATTRRKVSAARFTSTWNDTTNNQYVELANDGSTFTRFTNASSGSVTFASPDEGVDTNLAFSRWGTRTNETPTTGFNGQEIQEWTLFGTVDAVVSDDIAETLVRAIVAPGTITGTTVRECGMFGNDTLLTRHELAEFDVLANQRLSSSESSRFTGSE